MVSDCLKGTATTEFYALSVHYVLPFKRTGRRVGKAGSARSRSVPTHGPVGWQVSRRPKQACANARARRLAGPSSSEAGLRQRVDSPGLACQDRKSTRLNPSYTSISYAVFCLKKNKTLFLRQLHYLLQFLRHLFHPYLPTISLLIPRRYPPPSHLLFVCFKVLRSPFFTTSLSHPTSTCPPQLS